MKTELVTNFFWHNYKLLIHFLTPFYPHQLCSGLKVLVFLKKDLSLLSQVSVCIDYSCRGWVPVEK